MQCLAGAFLVPWDQLAAKTGVQARTPVDPAIGVEVYEDDFGVYPNKQAAMGAEFKRDTLNEFVYDISPKQTPFLSGVEDVSRVPDRRIHRSWDPD